MIAPRRPSSFQQESSAADPRRSYDRGAWAEAGEEGVASHGGESGEGAAAELEVEAPHSPLADVSTESLRRELERRQRGLAVLIARRDALVRQLAALDAQIRALDEEAGPRARRPSGGGRQPARLALPRPQNRISLPDAIALEIEVGQTITPGTAAKRVLASGYQTTAKTFTMVVANALSKDERFKRLYRGVYERIG